MYNAGNQGVQMTPQATGLALLDFVPNCLENWGSKRKNPVFERFDSMVHRANQWLYSHPEWRVVTAESYEVQGSSPEKTFADPDLAWYLDLTSMSATHHTNICLRLWITRRAQGHQHRPQEIAYFNITPQRISEGSRNTYPQYEAFSKALQRQNASILHQPIPGRIISMETQMISIHERTQLPDPDATIQWFTRTRANIGVVPSLRVFYEKGQSCMEVIGMQDFEPQVISSSKCAPLSSVMTEAQQWLHSQRGVRLTNIQTVESPEKNGFFFKKTLRLYITMQAGGSGGDSTPGGRTVSYKHFIPAQLQQGGKCISSPAGGCNHNPPDFERQSENVKRIDAWLHVTGCEVLSVETVPVRVMSVVEETDLQETYRAMFLRANVAFVPRVYLTGPYQEPPPGVLPPKPEMLPAPCCYCCCTIS